MSALDVIFSRRFVRVYTDERLDKATVRALLDAPVQAPTALHAVPGLVVVEDVNTLKRHSGVAKGLWSTCEVIIIEPSVAGSAPGQASYRDDRCPRRTESCRPRA